MLKKKKKERNLLWRWSNEENAVTLQFLASTDNHELGYYEGKFMALGEAAAGGHNSDGHRDVNKKQK